MGDAGDDLLLGNDGHDRLWGGDGKDELQGGAGDDQLDGGAGDDRLFGQVGNDIIWGGEGNDLLMGFTGSNETKQSLAAGETDDDILYGGAGSDVLIGGLGQDTLYGGADRDELQGGEGNDILFGEAGNDNLFGQVGNDVLYGGDGDDYLQGFTGSNETKQTLEPGESDDDFLYGGAGNDTLVGGVGNDYLDGGAGADIMIGGQGDDVYIVNSVNDTIYEKAGEGYDTVITSSNYLLSANIEELRLLEGYNIHGTGNALNNKIIGNSADNILDGVTGADTLIGGAGNDTYYVDNAGDVVIEYSGEGNDTVQTSINYTLGAHLENLVLLDFAKPEKGLVDGKAVLVYGYPKRNELDYMQGDAVENYAGTCALTSIANVLTQAGRFISERQVVQLAINNNWAINAPSLPASQLGGSNINDQRNILNNYGFRNDIVMGYNETGLANLLRSGRGVILAVNAGALWGERAYTGNGAVNHAVTLTGAVYDEADGTLAGFYLADSGRGKVSDMTRFVDIATFRKMANVPNAYALYTLEPVKYWQENINGTGNELDNRIVGNRGNNTLSGMAGNDVINGEGGDDTLYGGVGNDTLHGGEGRDTLYGGTGNDKLYLEDDDAFVDEAKTSLLFSTHYTASGSATMTAFVSGEAGSDRFVLIENLAPDAGSGLMKNLILDFDVNDTQEKIDLSNIRAVNAFADLRFAALTYNDAHYLRVWMGESGAATQYVTLAGYTLQDGRAIRVSDGIPLTADHFIFAELFPTLPDTTRTLTGTEQKDRLKVDFLDTQNTFLQGMGGNDNLIGGSGNDVLDGGAGNDTYNGGRGSDTYLFYRGAGQDRIWETGGNDADIDSVLMARDIKAEQLWFSKNHRKDLTVQIIGTEDQLTIQHWDTSPSVEQFKLNDGRVLMQNQVDKLVEAMAQFTPLAVGQTTLPTEYQTTLAPIFAASWQSSQT